MENTSLKLMANKSIWECTKCGHSNQYFLLYTSQTIACNSCNQLFELENGDYKPKGKNLTTKSNINFVFNIGSEVNLPKTGKCKVLGILVRQEKLNGSFWLEYSLITEEGKMLYLSCFEGNWHLFSEKNDILNLDPHKDKQNLSYDFNDYRLFNYYHFKNYCLVGEALHSVNPLEKRYLIEYISPPYIISVEIFNNVYEYAFEGKYMPLNKLKKLNTLEEGLSWPHKIGIGAAEPNLLQFRPLEAFKYFLALFFALVVINVCFNIFYRKNEKVLEYEFAIDQTNRQKMIKTPNFTLKGHSANLEIIGNHDVANDWAYCDITLVKVNSDLERSLEIEFDYYFGYTGGENWSEGDNRVVANLNNVEEGTYYLLVIPDISVASNSIHKIQLSAVWQPENYRNLMFSLLFMVLYWGFARFYYNFFEYERWQNGYFNPYENE